MRRAPASIRPGSKLLWCLAVLAIGAAAPAVVSARNGLPRGALGIPFSVSNGDPIHLKADLRPQGPYPTITLLIYKKFQHKNGGVYWHRVDNKRVCQHRKKTVKQTYSLLNWYTKNGKAQPGEYFLSIHGQHYTYDLALEKTSRTKQADGKWVNKVKLIGAKRGRLGNGR